MIRILAALALCLFAGPALAAQGGPGIGIEDVAGHRGPHVTLTAPDVGAVACPGTCAQRAAWLKQLELLVPSATQDLEANIADGPAGPVWLAWRSDQVQAGGVLESFVATRYALNTNQLAAVMTAAGAAVTSSGKLIAMQVPSPSQITFTQSGSGSIQRDVQRKLGDLVTAFDFGAAANQATSDLSAIKALIVAKSAMVGDGLKTVDLGGRAYAVDGPITLPTGIRLTNFKLLALASSNWTTSNAVIQTAAGGYNIAVDNGYIDCNGQAYNGYLNQASGYSSFDHLRIVHFLRRGGDIEASVTASDSEMSQWTPSDSQFNDPLQRTAYPLYIGPGGTDSQFTGLTPYVGLSPVYITGAHNIRFANVHPWNGRTDGTPIANPMIMDIEGGSYNIVINGGYLDTGYINCVVSQFSSCYLTIAGSFGFFDATAATYPQSIKVTTQVANADLSGLHLVGNIWPGGTLSTVQVATGGAGTWNLNPAAVAAYNQDFDTRRLTLSQRLGSSQSLVQGYDGQAFLTGNPSMDMTLTAPPTLVPPYSVSITLPFDAPHGVTVNTTGSGIINNNQTSVTLTPGQTYRLTVYDNNGGSAAHFSLN